MGNAWDSAKNRSDEAGTGGIFCKLADHGDKMTGAFVGDPHVEDLVYNPKLERYEPFTAEHEKAGVKPTPRFKLNFFQIDEDPKSKKLSGSMRIWEMNNQTFKDVLKCKEKYGFDDLSKAYTFEVERNGKKGSNKTTYSILPDKKLSEIENGRFVEQIRAAKLHDLTKAREGDKGDASTDMNSHKGAAAAPAAAASGNGAADVIDGDTASKLIGRLKVLPREKIAEFCTKFGIQQVRGLPKAKMGEAEAFLASLEGPPPAAAAPAEVDPFG